MVTRGGLAPRGRQQLQLGTFVVADGDAPVEFEGCEIELMALDLSTGKVTPAISALASHIEDGEAQVVSGHSNREGWTFRLRMRGDSRSMNKCEAAIDEFIGVRTEMRWRPADGLAAVTVFDVLHSTMDPVEVGISPQVAEVTKGYRVFLLTLTCLPWARGERPVTVTATTAAAPPADELDDGTSAAGWETAYNVGPYTVVAKSDRAQVLKVGPPDGMRYIGGPGRPYYTVVTARKAFAGALQRYLRVTALFESSDDVAFQIASPRASGSPDLIETLPDGWRRYYFDVTGAQAGDVFDFRAPVLRAQPDPVPVFWISTVDTVNVLPSLTAKQALVSVKNLGSKRAPVSLQISRPNQQLGEVLVCTMTDHQNGFSPSLRQFEVNPAGQANAARLSGYESTINDDPFHAAVPMRMIRPGTYEVIAVGANLANLELTWSNTTQAAGRTRELAALAPGYFQTLGTIALPQFKVPPEASGFLHIYLSGDGLLDELLLIPKGSVDDLRAFEDRTAHTIATSNRNLWLESPTIDQVRGAHWTGQAPDKSNAQTAVTAARGKHFLARGRTLVYVAASNVSAPPAVTARYFPLTPTFALEQPEEA